MRFVTFFAADGSRPGILIDGGVQPIDRVATLLDYIATPVGQREALHGRTIVPLRGLGFDAPVRPHKNVFCVGRNYAGHAAEIGRARGFANAPLPSIPTFFTKAPTAIAAPEALLELSEDASAQYDWEAELGVVIGRRCRDVCEAAALDVVFGYTCVNDVTARDLQRQHGQWFKGKSLDHTCPIGPWIVTADELGDGAGLDIELRLNGVRKQHSNTSEMIFGVAAIIASLSRGLTLEPGDVIATGTPDGVGFARTPPEFLKDADVVEVEIAGIGVLRNRVALTRTPVKRGKPDV